MEGTTDRRMDNYRTNMDEYLDDLFHPVKGDFYSRLSNFDPYEPSPYQHRNTAQPEASPSLYQRRNTAQLEANHDLTLSNGKVYKKSEWQKVRDGYNRGEKWAKEHPIVWGLTTSVLGTVLGFAMSKA